MATLTMWPPAIARVGVGRGVDGVVVILGVGRIDGDEGQFAPVLAAGERGRLRGLGFRETAPEKTCGMPWA